MSICPHIHVVDAPSGDRGGRRCPCSQPHAGARTPDLRPHRLTPNRVGASAPVLQVCATRRAPFPRPALADAGARRGHPLRAGPARRVRGALVRRRRARHGTGRAAQRWLACVPRHRARLAHARLARHAAPRQRPRVPRPRPAPGLRAARHPRRAPPAGTAALRPAHRAAHGHADGPRPRPARHHLLQRRRARGLPGRGTGGADARRIRAHPRPRGARPLPQRRARGAGPAAGRGLDRGRRLGTAPVAPRPGRLRAGFPALGGARRAA